MFFGNMLILQFYVVNINECSNTTVGYLCLNAFKSFKI